VQREGTIIMVLFELTSILETGNDSAIRFLLSAVQGRKRSLHSIVLLQGTDFV
jgi:hypothetical protein